MDEERKKEMRHKIFVWVVGALLLFAIIWMWAFSEIGVNAPVDTLEVFDLQVEDYEETQGGLFKSDTIKIIGKERNIQTTTLLLFNWNMENISPSQLVKGETVTCGIHKQGNTRFYTCGQQQKPLPYTDQNGKSRFLITLAIIIMYFLGIARPRR